MIHDLSNNRKQLRLHASQRLRAHFRSLARRVIGWNQDQSRFGSTSIGVTALETRVGTSTVARNLAAAIAGTIEGNVLLVESNFQRPCVTRRVPRDVRGLADVLRGDESPEQCILSTTIERLFFLGSGRISPRAAVELPLESLSDLNTEFDGAFEFVIYDLPIASDESLCFPVAHKLDGVLIVAEPSRFSRDRVRTINRRFTEMNTPVLGIVLNKT